jgi:hypothetical protein
VKSLDRLLAFALGAAVAVVVILAIVIWQSNYPFGFATVRETEELRARIAVLDRALRESELKAQSAAEQWERTADARAAAEAARLKEAQERAKRAEEEAAQAELVRARELAAKKARDDAQKAAAARQVAAEKVNAEPSHAETPPRVRNTAATQNDVEALYQQAAAMEGSGHARDAVRTYRRAARAGSGKAAKRLGDLFSCGGLGVVRDQTESSQWYDLAFRLGEPVPTRRDC